jgi:hypothetical protein
LSRRRVRALAPLVVVAVSVLAGSCTSGESDEEGSAVENTVRWDLAEPTSAADLGTDLQGMVAVNTQGSNGVDVRITMPGGDLVEGMFRQATATDGRDGQIEYVNLVKTGTDAAAEWEDHVERFVERWGGDRAAIDAFLAEARATVEGGGPSEGRFFDGDPQDGYRPSLELRASGPTMRVVVAYFFVVER